MKKKKLVYIISNIDKALAFEWIADSEKLHDNFEVSFLLLNAYESTLFQYLMAKGRKVIWIPYAGKRDMLKVIWSIFRYLRSERVAIVHTHLFDAGIAGLIAAKMAGVPKRIYTRHHSTLHHVYFPRAVYYDKLLNALATHIVAISKMVEEVLVQKESVHKEKVVLVHHGFHLDLFSRVREEQVNAVAKRNSIPIKAYPKIGVIARYTHWKGIQYIIPAFNGLLQKWPSAHLILANAKGDYTENILALLKTLPKHSYTQISFENDIPALYKVFDVYVHTPIDNHSEAFGQTYVEALAAKVPAVFTLSGVAAEYIQHMHNALVVDFKSSEEIELGVEAILTNKGLRSQLTEQGYLDVNDRFGFDKMITKLIDLYNRN